MIGHTETEAEYDSLRRQPHAATTPSRDPDPFVQVYITPPTSEDPWGTVETIRLSQAGGRTIVGQELDR